MRVGLLRGEVSEARHPAERGDLSPSHGRVGIRKHLFTLTIGLSAFLLFLTQPLYGRMLLPYLGGTSAVWNTAMCFFQVVLLAGYAYAHFSLKWLGWQWQPWLHLAVMALVVGFLPLGIPAGWTPDIQANPSFSVLGVLARGVGLPFFVLAASAPLLQRWFSLAHPEQGNPYVLYSASNVGSLLALLAFPVVLEPLFGLTEMSGLWSWIYLGLVGGFIGCALSLLRQSRGQRQRPPLRVADADEPVPSSSNRQRLHWLLLAAVPSGLLLAVTAHISTDVAAVSLLWVLPLALYLLTFVIVFSSRWTPGRSSEILTLLFGAVVVIVLIDLTWGLGPARHPQALGLHLLFFFIATLLCHARLAAAKPAAARLTEFYLVMSLGGALGGISVALIAPVVFSTTSEYPLLVVLTGLFSARMQPPFTHPLYRRFMWMITGLMMVLFGTWQMMNPDLQGLLEKGGMILLGCGLMVGVYVAVGRPLVYTAALLAFGLIGYGFTLPAHLVVRERNYFGAMSVWDEVRGGIAVRTLKHGTTAHGFQRLDAARRLDLTGYYHREGAFGNLLHDIFAEREEPQRVAIVGLGAGALGCYGKPGDTYQFYEIDPSVLKIAQNPKWFTFLRDCPPRKAVVLGDARLTLGQAPDQGYDLIILDAFSSDSIPVHLMTLEALELYQRKLKRDGLIIYHISNGHLDLRPVVDALADEINWVAYHSDRDALVEKPDLILPTVLAVLGRDQDVPSALKTSGRWARRAKSAGRLLWTDDFANLWGAYRFGWR